MHPLCVTQGCNSIICRQQCDTATLLSNDAVSCMHPTRKLLDAATSCSALSHSKRSNTSGHHLIGQVWVRCVRVLIQTPDATTVPCPQGAGHPASSTKQAAQMTLGCLPWGHGARWNSLQAGEDLLPVREAALAQAEP